MQEVKEYWGMDEKSFIALMHISQLAGLFVPVAGFTLPIVMWATNSDNALIDEHGKNILNWLISLLIYSLVSAILIFAVVGLFLLFILVVLSIVFPIIGAVNAGNDKVWNYPLTIRFVK